MDARTMCSVYTIYTIYWLWATTGPTGHGRDVSASCVRKRTDLQSRAVLPSSRSPPLVQRLPIGDEQRPRNTAQTSAGVQGPCPSSLPSPQAASSLNSQLPGPLGPPPLQGLGPALPHPSPQRLGTAVRGSLALWLSLLHWSWLQGHSLCPRAGGPVWA